LKIGVEPIDHRLVAADHHAVTAVDAPDTAGGADIQIVDAALLQRLAAAHVVLPERIAAVDDGVAAFHQICKRIDGCFGDLACREHHPGGTRPLELLDELFERIRTGRAVPGDCGHGRGVFVVDDGRMSLPHQPPDDVAAHPSQADHAELHFDILNSTHT
jgi:hypothetical protein